MNTPQEFQALLRGLQELQRRDFAGGAALATLTRTRGPAFRRPGARILVNGDGSVVGALAGGCPEGDIVARALEVIRDGVPRLVRYNQEYGLDVLVESGCGGELEVLIEPLRATADLAFVESVARCLAARRRGVLATLFARDGVVQAPRRLVWDGSVVVDQLGDATLAAAAIAAGRDDGPAATVERVTTASGVVDVLVERLRPPQALVVLGGGPAAQALLRLGVLLGWSCTLVDHRGDAPLPPGLPPGVQFVRAGPAAVAGAVALDARSAVVAMTHNLQRDIDYLAALGEAPVGYLGAVGSRSRAARLAQATGLAAPRLRAPAGLDLGSETPEEIALAIAAEILACVTGHGGGVLSRLDGPIH